MAKVHCKCCGKNLATSLEVDSAIWLFISARVSQMYWLKSEMCMHENETSVLEKTELTKDEV